jgi:hypothetical protein
MVSLHTVGGVSREYATNSYRNVAGLTESSLLTPASCGRVQHRRYVARSLGRRSGSLK